MLWLGPGFDMFTQHDCSNDNNNTYFNDMISKMEKLLVTTKVIETQLSKFTQNNLKANRAQCLKLNIKDIKKGSALQ